MVTLQSLKRKRDKRVDMTGTPPAIFINSGDIAVDTNGGGWIIDFTEESKTRKYAPFDTITINNTSSSDLNIYVNQKRAWQKLCRQNSQSAIIDFPSVRSIRISKRDSGVTISAGEIEVNVERAPLTDDEYRRREQNKNPIVKAILSRLGV